MTEGTQEPIGLLAGWGRYPVVVADAIRSRGHRVCCVGYIGHAQAEIVDACDEFRWLGLAKLGGTIRYFKSQGVRLATMAGKIHKVSLLQNGFAFRSLPDWTCIRTFFDHFVTAREDRKDDTLLLAIVKTFEKNGIELRPATDFAPDLLARIGFFTHHRLTRHEKRDIDFGWHLAREMGRLDVGQSVCVKGRAIIAVEAIEGTDECIRRAGQLCRGGGFTVVKVAKPQQDMRFDVPTIGIGTLQTMVEAGARVLAIEAGKTIVVDEQDVMEFANRHKITIVSLQEGGAFQEKLIAERDAKSATNQEVPGAILEE